MKSPVKCLSFISSSHVHLFFTPIDLTSSQRSSILPDISSFYIILYSTPCRTAEFTTATNQRAWIFSSEPFSLGIWCCRCKNTIYPLIHCCKITRDTIDFPRIFQILFSRWLFFGFSGDFWTFWKIRRLLLGFSYKSGFPENWHLCDDLNYRSGLLIDWWDAQFSESARLVCFSRSDIVTCFEKLKRTSMTKEHCH